MITKIVRKNFGIQSFLRSSLVSYQFGSGAPSNYKVHIDKDATWIKYKTNRRLAWVDGIEDIHYQMIDPDMSDPFIHLKENPILSLQNLALNDPYFHEDDDEALVNEIHGYQDDADPIDSRWDVVVPNYTAMTVFLMMIALWFISEEHPPSEAYTFREKVYQDHIEEVLAKKNSELNDIKDNIKALCSKVSE